MNKQKLVNQAVGRALVTNAAVLASHGVAASPANAAQSPAKLGKIEVTGSRIKHTVLRQLSQLPELAASRLSERDIQTLAIF